MICVAIPYIICVIIAVVIWVPRLIKLLFVQETILDYLHYDRMYKNYLHIVKVKSRTPHICTPTPL